MIRACTRRDIPVIDAIINQAAHAYKGVIPPDCWHEPYMPQTELLAEIAAGVQFWGWQDPASEDSGVLGVMGIQQVGNKTVQNGKSATLIRHAYVLPGHQSRGIGGALLNALIEQWEKQSAERQTTISGDRTRDGQQLLVGTWAAAEWAIRFYERHDFRLLPSEEKDRLLNAYYSIHARQRETSVVLAYVGQR